MVPNIKNSFEKINKSPSNVCREYSRVRYILSRVCFIKVNKLNALTLGTRVLNNTNK